MPMIEPVKKRQLILAPMEGVMDYPLRAILTQVGGVDRCVSEFIRVTDRVLPNKTFHRLMPELMTQSLTGSGVPVRAQLLGSDPDVLAANAARLIKLGAEGIDLNFGCPTKTVNRHRGGAVLLQEPDLLHRIVSAVRQAVPTTHPVSAKMRLGYVDTLYTIECAQALQAGGVGEIVVHARTKMDGYRPPAYWERIPAIRAAVSVPVIANGEIWTVADALRCRELSQCDSLMLGRGIVADPGLALSIRAADQGQHFQMTWETVEGLLRDYWQLTKDRFEPRHHAGRIKQWLHLLVRRFPEAQPLYDTIRVLSQPQAIRPYLFKNEVYS